MPIGTPLSSSLQVRFPALFGRMPAPVAQAPVVPTYGPAGRPSIASDAYLASLMAAFNRAMSTLNAMLQRLNAGQAPGAPVVSPAPRPAPAPRPVPVVPPSVPSGPAISFRDALARTPKGQPAQLGAGTYAFDDFRPTPVGATGAFVMNAASGLAGAGVDRTVIQMKPGSSTHAKDVPTEAFVSNPLSLMRFNGGSPQLHDFTLRGTSQGHMYGGMVLAYVQQARVNNVKVTGIPGNDGIPPGETFSIADYRSQGSVYRNIEIDGQGIAGSCFGGNRATDLTIEHGYFHGSGSASGVAIWRCHNVNLTDCTASNNKLVGFNFECASGVVNVVRPVMHNNRYDMAIVSDEGSAVYNIIDPVFDGPKLRIHQGPKYMGKPNLQRREDIHVYINGVDRTADVVQWV